MAKQTTITFGTSVHYFKSSVSITLDQGVDETLDNIEEIKKKVTEIYYQVLSQELLLTKKFEKMTTKEIKEYIKKKLKNDKWVASVIRVLNVSNHFS